MMDEVQTSEMLLNSYQSRQCYNPEDSHLPTMLVCPENQIQDHTGLFQKYIHIIKIVCVCVCVWNCDDMRHLIYFILLQMLVAQILKISPLKLLARFTHLTVVVFIYIVQIFKNKKLPQLNSAHITEQNQMKCVTIIHF
jgi:hypothetical protein